jgi:hypothetical protein
METNKRSDKAKSLFGRKKVAEPKVVKTRVVKPKVVAEPIIEKEIVEPIVEKVEEPIIIKEENVMSNPVNEIEDFEVPNSYSPIAEPVIERSYNEATILSEIGDIPEPDYASGGMTFEDFADDVVEEEVAPKEPTAFEKMSNPAMTDLDNKESKFAAAQLVDTILDGYEMLHQLGAKAAKVSEDKVTKMVMAGEIDNDIRIPVSETDDLNALEYVAMHNQQAEELFEYDKSFNDKVRPTMIRVFQKNRWGVSDEQFLMIAFGKDIATKGVMAFSFNRTAKSMIENFALMTVQNKQNIMQQAPRQVYTPDSIEVKPKEETTVEMKVETVKMSIEDIEAQMMED